MKPSLPTAALLAATLLAGNGCMLASYGDVRPYAPMAPVQPPMTEVGPATPGAIYRSGPSLNLYGDHRARDVGDLLTINLVESTTATTSASTGIDKSSKTALSAGAVLGGPLTLNGRDLLNTDMSGDRSFSGKGNSAQSNKLQGSLTVTVVQRLPNGNLVVQGEKNMRLNQGDELVQIQGVIRPLDIATDNSVSSSRVADARIVYGGRGPIAKSNAMGWLGRFFNSPIFPN